MIGNRDGASIMDLVTIKANAGSASRLEIPIQRDGGERIGVLRCIDSGLLSDDATVELLTIWRNRHMAFFLTQFEATPDRTLAWLRGTVLPAADRILFLIVDAEGRSVGNIGLCNVAEGSAEIDNVVKGEESSTPRIAFFALKALLDWAFRTLEIPAIVLRVLSDNEKAIRLYTAAGFNAVETLSLTKIETAGGIRYLVDADEGCPVGFGYLLMTLSRKSFTQA